MPTLYLKANPQLIGWSKIESWKIMLLIKNGRVVDPKSGLDTQADVLVDGKKVVKIAENIEAGDAQVIDATGLVAVSYTHLLHTL